jgi:hypothetical protein
MPKATPTTMKIDADLHEQLLRAAKKTRVSKADLLRLCVDCGLHRVEQKFTEMRGGIAEGMGLILSKEQAEELRELYRSAVTDLVPVLEDVEGKEFVTAVERTMALPAYSSPAITPAEVARVNRFLAVYAQLF